MTTYTKERNSVFPPTTHLTFAPWIYLVPQYKPESVLMLGYSGGTTAGLIRLLYGNVPITAVDIESCEDSYGVNFIQADAQDYIKTCGHFDTIILDLFMSGKYENPSFMTEEWFVKTLSQKGNYIVVNTLKEPDMGWYRKYMQKVGINSPSGVANQIWYFKTKEISNLTLYD